MISRHSLFVLVVSLGLVLVACEKPDASYVTSPSIKTLTGTTAGNVVFNPPETAPEPVTEPEHWDVNFDLARFAKLENESPALELLMQVETRPGYGMEIWLTTEGRTVARWTAGSTTSYNGTVCFQLELERDGDAVPLGTGKHQATLVFRDPAGPVLVAKRLEVTNFTPKLDGSVPGPESTVFRAALACRRGG